MSSERRSSQRYQFIAEAEVVEITSGMRLRAKTGDLSIGGCFLGMLNPSPEGTEVQLTISREGTKLTGSGRVVFVAPNLGMGVSFNSFEPKQLATLQKWLAELSGDPSAGLAIQSRPSLNTKS
jgi:PilZ domain